MKLCYLSEFLNQIRGHEGREAAPTFMGFGEVKHPRGSVPYKDNVHVYEFTVNGSKAAAAGLIRTYEELGEPMSVGVVALSDKRFDQLVKGGKPLEDSIGHDGLDEFYDVFESMAKKSDEKVRLVADWMSKTPGERMHGRIEQDRMVSWG